jgi:plasmid stabilization system protein ParE
VAWRVKWTEFASRNLKGQADYIAQDSQRYADALIREAREAARSLRQFPNRGRVVPEEKDPTVRELFIFHSYRLLYRVVASDHEVQILAFVHGARDLEKALDEG